MIHSQNKIHSLYVCKQSLDSDTRNQIETLEAVQNLLEQSKSNLTYFQFLNMLDRSVIAIYDLVEKHWKRMELVSLANIMCIMEKWAIKFNFQGKLKILFYISKAMLQSESLDKSTDFIQKARYICTEQLIDAQYLIPKICLIQGDILSKSDPDEAYKSYQKAINQCKDKYPFVKFQNVSELKSYMMQSFYKSAVMKKLVDQNSTEILSLLQQSKKYAADLDQKNISSYLVGQIQNMYQTEHQKQTIRRAIEQQKHEEQLEEPIIVQERQIQVETGQGKQQFILMINYLKIQQKITISLQSKQSQQIVKYKEVDFCLSNMRMIQNIGNNIQNWINIDKNLKITVDQTCLQKISEGNTIKYINIQKGKVLKTIKNKEMFPKNMKWDTSSDEFDQQIEKKNNK